MTNKEKLEKWIKDQKESYAVIVDENMHKKQTMPVRTIKELITVKKCKKIVDAVQSKFDIEVNKIEIMMSEFDYEIFTEDDVPYIIAGDVPVPQRLDKKAYYWVKSNCLQIWEDGLPIYENNNGEICGEREALADCLC